MLRITRLTDYATVVLAELARTPGAVCSAGELAARTRVSTPTAGKVLKALAAAGLVTSERGAHGGYALARDPDAITAADVLAAIEGPPALTDCSVDRGLCNLEATCAVRPGWQHITAVVQRTLESITLSQLAGDTLVPAREQETL